MNNHDMSPADPSASGGIPDFLDPLMRRLMQALDEGAFAVSCGEWMEKAEKSPALTAQQRFRAHQEAAAALIRTHSPFFPFFCVAILENSEQAKAFEEWLSSKVMPGRLENLASPSGALSGDETELFFWIDQLAHRTGRLENFPELLAKWLQAGRLDPLASRISSILLMISMHGKYRGASRALEACEALLERVLKDPDAPGTGVLECVQSYYALSAEAGVFPLYKPHIHQMIAAYPPAAPEGVRLLLASFSEESYAEDAGCLTGAILADLIRDRRVFLRAALAFLRFIAPSGSLAPGPIAPGGSASTAKAPALSAAAAKQLDGLAAEICNHSGEAALEFLRLATRYNHSALAAPLARFFFPPFAKAILENPIWSEDQIRQGRFWLSRPSLLNDLLSIDEFVDFLPSFLRRDFMWMGARANQWAARAVQWEEQKRLTPIALHRLWKSLLESVSEYSGPNPDAAARVWNQYLRKELSAPGGAEAMFESYLRLATKFPEPRQPFHKDCIQILRDQFLYDPKGLARILHRALVVWDESLWGGFFQTPLESDWEAFYSVVFFEAAAAMIHRHCSEALAIEKAASGDASPPDPWLLQPRETAAQRFLMLHALQVFAKRNDTDSIFDYFQKSVPLPLRASFLDALGWQAGENPALASACPPPIALLSSMEANLFLTALRKYPQAFKTYQQSKSSFETPREAKIHRTPERNWFPLWMRQIIWICFLLALAAGAVYFLNNFFRILAPKQTQSLEAIESRGKYESYEVEDCDWVNEIPSEKPVPCKVDVNSLFQECNVRFRKREKGTARFEANVWKLDGSPLFEKKDSSLFTFIIEGGPFSLAKEPQRQLHSWTKEMPRLLEFKVVNPKSREQNPGHSRIFYLLFEADAFSLAAMKTPGAEGVNCDGRQLHVLKTQKPFKTPIEILQRIDVTEDGFWGKTSLFSIKYQGQFPRDVWSEEWGKLAQKLSKSKMLYFSSLIQIEGMPIFEIQTVNLPYSKQDTPNP